MQCRINVARVDVRDIIITVEIILFSYNPWSLTSYTMDYIYRNIIRFIAIHLYPLQIYMILVLLILVLSRKILDSDKSIFPKYSLEFETSICRVIPGNKM